MPVLKIIEEKIAIPKGVKITLDGTKVKVKGPTAELSREFVHPRMSIKQEGEELVVGCSFPKKKERAVAGTWAAHLMNMIRGSISEFEYTMKIVYAHFPMKVSVKGREIAIENFLGEKTPRHTTIMGKSTKVVVKGDLVIVTSHNREDAGQTAARIEKMTRIKNFDPRVYQDGIYIVEKPKKEKTTS